MRRLGGRMPGRVDPDFTAIHSELLLPHWDPLFHPFDHVAAGLERLGAMRCRRDDRDARLTDGGRPHAVSYGDPRLGPATAPVYQDPADLGFHPLFVRLVID